MTKKKRVYWDACVWFALIKQEPGRYDRCKHIVELAQAGDIEIWTSTLTLAEVFRKNCGGEVAVGLAENLDKDFEQFLLQDFVVEVQVDRAVGVRARRLLRSHGALKKPADAVHLATAALNDIDELHTFDQANLLSLDALVDTRSNGKLKICEPPEAPQPEPQTGDLFAEPAVAPQVEALVDGRSASAPSVAEATPPTSAPAPALADSMTQSHAAITPAPAPPAAGQAG